MNPSNLKHRIDIYANVEYENELGETSRRFEKLKTIWSAIIPQTGSLQKQQADTILTNVTHKIIIRYSAGNDISKEMKIKFRNHEFEIRYILNPYFNNETLEIFVQEVLG
ncbi:phage head closure protein [Lysinibacillus sphaericus]|uniref:phage head closure protein n=1 Tax=Lysinibacillus sphaericus TaxID=1421 RepID=UPI003D023D7A